ncbi:MAG: OmpA family protein [Deltaproteobacteria bacterium]|nr:OmpA family protein [Deltaproteobacteria bacterium]
MPDGSLQKTQEPKEEIIEMLKAKNENEEAVTEEKGMDAEPAQQVSEDIKQVEETKVKLREQTDKDKIYFAAKSHTLNASAKTILKDTAAWLKDNPKATLVIEGHGNEYKNSEKNLILGELRAGSVKSYLIKQGINEMRLRVVSYGAERSSRSAKKMKLKNWRACILVKELENK